MAAVHPPAYLEATTPGVTVPLESMTTTATVTETGGLAVRLQQSFRNSVDRSIEAVFKIALPPSSAVSGFAADITDNDDASTRRRIEGVLAPTHVARETYDETIAAGDGALLVESAGVDKAGRDIFRLSLGNLEPGSRVEIDLHFVGEASLVRAIEADASALADASDAASQRPAFEFVVADVLSQLDGDISHRVVIHARATGASIECATHTLTVTVDPASSMVGPTGTWDGASFGGNDMYIHVRPPPLSADRQAAQISLASGQAVTHAGSGDTFVSLALAPALSDASGGPAATAANGHDLVFVVDRSGSMQNKKRLRRARECLQLFLRSLPASPGTTFQIIGFGSDLDVLFDGGPSAYTEDSLNLALRYVKKMKADLGGTDIRQAFLAAVAQARPAHAGPAALRTVFLLTDGEVRNVGACVEAAEQNAAAVRCFAIGLGAGADGGLVRRMAAAAGGVGVKIADSSNLNAVVMAQLERALRPSVRNLVVDWAGLVGQAGGEPSVVCPAQGADAGQHRTCDTGSVHRVYALFRGSDDTRPSDGLAVVRGTVGGSPFEVPIEVNISSAATVSADDASGESVGDGAADRNLFAIATRAIVSALGGGKAARDAVRDEMVRLALQAGIASEETAFVAVDVRAGPSGDTSAAGSAMKLLTVEGGTDGEPLTVNGQVVMARKPKRKRQHDGRDRGADYRNHQLRMLGSLNGTLRPQETFRELSREFHGQDRFYDPKARTMRGGGGGRGGGRGGGLGFLSHKAWHPRTSDSKSKVWEIERMAAAGGDMGFGVGNVSLDRRRSRSRSPKRARRSGRKARQKVKYEAKKKKKKKTTKMKKGAMGHGSDDDSSSSSSSSSSSGANGNWRSPGAAGHGPLGGLDAEYERFMATITGGSSQPEALPAQQDSPTPAPLVALLGAQAFAGFFPVDAVATAAGVSADDLCAAARQVLAAGVADDGLLELEIVFATLVACALMRGQWAHHRLVWLLISRKAQTWLATATAPFDKDALAAAAEQFAAEATTG